MIPIRDDAPRWGFPFVTIALIAANVLVFLYQTSLFIESPQQAEVFVQVYGAIPLRAFRALTGHYPVVDGLAPVFTSMFLHGGLMHLLGNMWFLWIFGDNIEDELGHFSYLLFYLACGLAAWLAHFSTDPASVVPAVGASGAISGVMGAYVVRFPWARIVVLIPIIIVFTTIEVPALVMLLYWFLIQFFSGAAEYGQQAGAGVAWFAHVGGFVAGAILIWSRPRRRRQRRAYHN
jgi:membrane associated rhomboid family serine protease